MSKKLRKGDRVLAISGNEKGRVGEVLSRQGDKVVVQGFKVCKKAVKQSEQNRTGFAEFERPIHISNLRVCVGENTPVKLKMRTDENGERGLYYFSDGEPVKYRTIKKPKKA
jgi:large subunit ribosomal protein L24